MPASDESSAGTARSVLLIEEYDALAAAITSALKKFAPEHRTRTVESLSEAEAAAAQARPQLFVLDFDPPQSHAVEFLNRISAAYPEARLLVITSGAYPEIASERFGPNGIQFVEKPFELAEFGAAVQALLGPWTKAASGDSRGTLRDLNLRDLIPLECVSGASAALKITAEGGRIGEVHFLDGHICHASAPGLEGLNALVEILGWQRAKAKEGVASAKAARTIQGPWQHVFLDALRKAKASVDFLKLPSPPECLVEESKPAETPKEGKKVVVIDDTEMLLIFVEDALTTAEPSLQIVTANTGTEGAARVEAILPDLVLLDYSLPDLRGDQVCERFLGNKATARIPVVIMSGHVPEMMATAERCCNVVATIAKPFMSDALISLVKKTLAQGSRPAEVRKTPSQASPPIKKLAAAIPSSATPAKQRNDTRVTQSASARTTKEPVKVVPSIPPSVSAPAPTLAPSSSIEIVEPSQQVTSPIISPSAVRPIEHPPKITPVSPSILPARLASPNATVVLGLGMEVIAVQFGSRFQVDAIRVRPSPITLSLAQVTAPSVLDNRWGSGFELGTVDLDPSGRIRTMRVLPMRRPAASIRPRNGFDINDIKLVSGTASIQLTAGMSLPMTMQVVTRVKVMEVELSDRFEVAQLILHPEGSRVRATLDSESRTGAGAEFETVRVRLDSSAHMAELVLRLVAVD